jgi:hypothetical protein
MRRAGGRDRRGGAKRASRSLPGSGTDEGRKVPVCAENLCLDQVCGCSYAGSIPGGGTRSGEDRRERLSVCVRAPPLAWERARGVNGGFEGSNGG